MAKRTHSAQKRMPAARRTRRAEATVVDLSSVRALRRRELAERSVRAAMNENRSALRRLFATGLLFTQKGARAGRELLLSHQSLLRIVDLFARLADTSAIGDAALQQRAEEAFLQLDAQLARAAQLTARAGEFVSGRGGD